MPPSTLLPRRVRSAFFALLLAGPGLASATLTAAPAQNFDVKAYGATGDGHTLDTAAINRAIDAAHAAGGGTVLFTPGTYLAGSIHLQSNLTLRLESGAVIEATSDPAAYDAPEPNPAAGNYQDFGHSHWHNSLLWGENLHDIAILGPGLIWGKGLIRGAGHDFDARAMGNKSIALKNCRNVILRDFSILHGGWFGLLLTGVDNLTIDNLKIDTNRDGMDIDACRNVRVSDCTVNSPWDDGICLKSSYGLGVVRPTENVTITNCQVSGYEEGTLLDGTFQRDGHPKSGPTGRIKLGTESTGGFKNITISNCVFDYCRGLAIETVDGGDIDGLSISNLTMRDIVNSPIFIRLGNRARSPGHPPPAQLRHVLISNVVVLNGDARYASLISGLPGHDIEDLRLSNIRIIYNGGGTKADAARVPPEKEDGYPEPSMFGVVPAYGFYIRHVNGLEFDHVAVSYLNEDQRPAIVLSDVKNADFDHVRAQHAPGVPTLVLDQVNGLALHNCPGLPDAQRGAIAHEAL